MRALVLGDGPSYHAAANVNWRLFDGLIISTHYYRHSADVVVSIDPRMFETKERIGLGKSRVVVALSHWGNQVGLKRYVPRNTIMKLSGGGATGQF